MNRPPTCPPFHSATFHLKTTNLTLTQRVNQRNSEGAVAQATPASPLFDAINLHLFICGDFFYKNYTALMYASGFLDIMAWVTIEVLGLIFFIKRSGRVYKRDPVAHGSFLQVPMEALG